MAKKINVGGVPMGGGAPVTVQSMTNTKTEDPVSTVRQIKTLEAAGCDIVRVAVPNMDAAKAIGRIKEEISIPLVADIHFDYRLAVEAAAAGADKIRINPGNIGGEEKVKAVVKACRERGLPIRIGVNGGSLEKELLGKYGLTPRAMVESAMGHVRLLNRFDFDDICISVKSSDVKLTVEAYRLLSEETDYPLHIGVTEAGSEYMGVIKNSIGIGALLLDGIGDTIRVSLTAPPEKEVKAGVAMLRALGLRRGVRIVSCPTCGRTNIDLFTIAKQVEERLEGCERDITVAVMGCAVNGPGEASHADFGIAGGNNEGILFMKGRIVRKVPMERLTDELIGLIEEN
ncbi:MAG: flavodoxin-dependent (E)-4-hydroxy-3-methylbut-2-enyl-diphosphate synthase [Oscillospiraceae bacterium]|nr:flavodoxin-dependent (E)-4-hydroxy-3-methylbut-2-enyl-diphosphate synthase [Oscillospiraceae bacterium]